MASPEHTEHSENGPRYEHIPFDVPEKDSGPTPFFITEDEYVIKHQGLINGIISIGLLIGAQQNLFSIWWLVGHFLVTTIPYEVKEIREYGLEAYLSELHIQRPTTRGVGVIVGGLVLCFVTILTVVGVGDILFNITESSGGQHLLSDATYNVWIWVGAVAMMFLVVGPLEEYLFRHKLQSFIMERQSLGMSVLLTNGIFGLLHLPMLALGGGSIITYVIPVIGLGLLGSIYSLQYIYTDNLTVPALTHGAYNSILVTGLFITQSGLL
jgi:membrane protease YdiL (CAAX protease family)